MSSRRQIDIKEVYDNMLCLGKNDLKIILRVSSLNFELKSETEQDIILENYQAFLNSLTFPLQILVRIRTLDINEYISKFANPNIRDGFSSLRQQYCAFIKKHVSLNKILAREFYIIISVNRDIKPNLVKGQLLIQSELIEKNIKKLGLKTDRLKNIEIIDLFYSFYAPLTYKTQSFSGLTQKLVSQGY